MTVDLTRFASFLPRKTTEAAQYKSRPQFTGMFDFTGKYSLDFSETRGLGFIMCSVN